LSPQWLEQADDGSAEFRLAIAVAGIVREHNIVGPFRVFLEEVEVTKFVNWSPGSTSAVWSNRSLAANLAAVFRRRQLEAFREGLNRVPIYSRRPTRLSDILGFLNEQTNDEKLTALLWALPSIDWSHIEFRAAAQSDNEDLNPPFEFGVPRLLVEPLPLVARGQYWIFGETNEPTTPDPDVFHLIASGQKNAIAFGVDRAARRLKSGGRHVNGYRNRGQAGKPLAVLSTINADRLLASMLFPLSYSDLELVANRVLYPPESEE
jgi:CRISPR-associated protein Csx17